MKVAEDRAEASGIALKKAEADLSRMLSDHFDAFAAEGEEYVRTAVDALLEVEEPLRCAEEAWRRAAEQWRTLTPLLRQRIGNDLVARGVHAPIQHIDALSRVPSFPLPADLAVFGSARNGGVAPRPQALRLPSPPAVEVTDAAEGA